MRGTNRCDALKICRSPTRSFPYSRLSRFLVTLGVLVPVAAAWAGPRLAVERVGPVVIEAANNFSENTRVRVRVADPAPGRNGAKHMIIEEWRTRVYDGRDGATLLPMTLDVSSGRAELVLKSLARFNVYDSRNAPIPQVAFYYGDERVLIDVPQWVDEDANEKTDWLEARIENILLRARASGIPEVVEVVSSLGGWKESFKRDCGGFIEQDPRFATISSVCIDWDGINVHRLNQRNELTATVLHELRHVWTHYRPSAHPYKQKLLAAPSGQRELQGCPPGRDRVEMCSIHIRDERYAAQEADAEAFANKYKDLFP